MSDPPPPSAEPGQAARPLIAALHGFAAPGARLDLDIRVGDMVLLRGANGSGKTSLLRALAGLPTVGLGRGAQARAVGGADPASLPARELARLLQFAKQDPAETLAGLTVAGEFRLRGTMSPPALADLLERDVATLSSGEARRVSLAVTAAASAPLLLLDEPMEGLDPQGRRGVRDVIAHGTAHGAVVVADHGDDLTDLATRILDLSPPDAAEAFAFPSHAPPTFVAAPATAVSRGDRAIVLPSVHLGAGFHVVRGPNASGKSTLLLHLAGLLGPGALVDGAPAQPGGTVQLLLPRAADLFTRETVAAELEGADSACVSRLVPREIAGRHPLSLSAGEAQRVALAKTLGRPGRLYLLDEPEAHLDRGGRRALLAAVADRIAAGACVVAATHDAELLDMAHKTLALGAA